MKNSHAAYFLRTSSCCKMNFTIVLDGYFCPLRLSYLYQRKKIAKFWNKLLRMKQVTCIDQYLSCV